MNSVYLLVSFAAFILAGIYAGDGNAAVVIYLMALPIAVPLVVIIGCLLRTEK